MTNFPVTLRVYGTPIPQGSKSGYIVNGRVNMVEGKGKGAKRHKDWRRAVSEAAEAYVAEHGEHDWDTPCEVSLLFLLARPKSRNKKIEVVSVKPDLDKLTRSIFDAISSVTGTPRILKNDSRVCRLTAEKRYVDDPADEGVVINVAPLDHQGNRR